MKKPSEREPLTDVTIVTVFRFARHRRREVEPKRSLGMRESSHDDAPTLWRVAGQRIGNVRNKGREVSLPEVLSWPVPTRGSWRNSEQPIVANRARSPG
jgi:hypothetical protein